MHTSSRRIDYFDGLRALGLINVVLCHAAVSGMLPSYSTNFFMHSFVIAGRNGLSVFFVLSGFIIAYLLLQNKHANRIEALSAFYVRRFFKLVPSVVILVAVVAIANWNYQTYSCSTVDYISALTFTKEFFLPSDLSRGCVELVHLWSLTVEEIFYLSWAPAILFLPRRYRTLALPLFLLLGMGATYLEVTGRTTNGRFPVLPHLSELIMGATLAELYFNQKLGLLKKHSHMFGCLLIAGTLFTVVEYCSFAYSPNVWIQILRKPILGLFATSIVAYGLLFRTSLIARAVACKPLVFIGKRSYSGYLWHEVLFLFSTHGEPIPFWQTPMMATVGLLVMGYLSYELVELNFQNLGRTLSGKLLLSKASPPARRLAA